MVCVEIDMRPMRSPRMAAMGASRTGARSISIERSALRKPLTQRISGKIRMTWRKASRMPMNSTPMMTPFRAGLARKEV